MIPAMVNGDLRAALEPKPEYTGTMERLKLEVEIAIWNWERRNHLPHYDGGGFAVVRFAFGSKGRAATP